MSIDLSDPASSTSAASPSGSCPRRSSEEAFALLRREAPIAPMPPIEDALAVIPQENPTGYRAIIRYEDIRAISRDPKTFCSGEGVRSATLRRRCSRPRSRSSRWTRRATPSCAGSSRRRSRRGRSARIEDGIRRAPRRSSPRPRPTGGGDFVDLIAKRLPLQTISDMIGVPEADRARVVEGGRHARRSRDDPVRRRPRPAVEVLGEALWTLTRSPPSWPAEREKSPQDDLMTALVQAEIDGDDSPTPRSRRSSCCSRSRATTPRRHTTSHAMRALTQHPDQRELLLEDLDGADARRRRGDRALGDAGAALPPHRHARGRDARPDDRPGEKVMLFYHSGNRDETAFDDPWRFDIDAASRTATSASAAAGRTTAWAPRWPARSCARSSPSC